MQILNITAIILIVIITGSTLKAKALAKVDSVNISDSIKNNPYG